MNNKIKFNKMCINVITPTNIANNQKLDPIDYIYDAKSQIAYFFNPVLWHKFIYTHNLLDSYEKFLVNPKSKKNIYSWLINEGYTIKEILPTIKYKLYADKEINAKNTLNNIICQIKSMDGNVYIPGSSIKGLIRTAILVDLINKNPKIKDSFWQKIYTAKQIGYNTKAFSSSLNKIISDLENKFLSLDERKIMQGIQVSDSFTNQKEIPLILLKKHDITATNINEIKEHDICLFRECILPETKFYFNLQIDTSFTEKIGINSVDDILKVLENYFVKTNNIFKKAFGKECTAILDDTYNANAYLGGGTGFLTKTIIANLAPDEKSAVDVISHWLDMSFRGRSNRQKKDTIISPRTLKTVKYNGKTKLLGAVKIDKL